MIALLLWVIELGRRFEALSQGTQPMAHYMSLYATFMQFMPTYLSGGNPTVADAILDRLVSGAHRLELKGNQCAS
jgi:hypothetical protein